MTWNVISTFILDQLFGYQTANKIRENLIVIASGREGRDLGGSRLIPANPMIGENGELILLSKQNGTGPFDAVGYIDVELDGTNQTGMTFQARVEVRVEGAAPGTITCTPKIRNVTDSTDAGTGVACSAGDPAFGGTNQKQTIALTIASGVKKYRLMFSLSSPSCTVWVTGEIERFASA